MGAWRSGVLQCGFWFGVLLGGLSAGPSAQAAVPQVCPAPQLPPPLALTEPSPYAGLLRRSWEAYGDRFIQSGGRVVDFQAEDDRTTSEGQAYAMLRAVLINDQARFNQTLVWAEQNLARPSDSLWAWHWTEAGGIVDQNFATDADIDAATALIFAARRWDCGDYEALATQKIRDIARLGIAEIELAGDHPRRFILPGPRQAFVPLPELTIFNPSYFSPYAYRLFAQVDPSYDWLGLVDDGYRLLDAMTAVSPVGLPADWLGFNPQTGQFSPLPPERRLQSNYSFDAFRVWWRVSLDDTWFDEPRAEAYLRRHLQPLAQRWRAERSLPAVLSLDGTAQVEYDATAQYAMLYPAMRQVNRGVAFELFMGKLLANYSRGLWDNDEAYYSQNLAWFALLPAQGPVELLQP